MSKNIAGKLFTRAADIVDASTRSRMMASVRQSGTSPELEIRRMVRRVGQPYRLNNARLPGSPDLSNATRRWAIFVNGCFWHGHRNCPKTKGGKQGRVPVVRREFWERKLEANRERDRRKATELRRRGIRVLIIWECEIRNLPRLESRLIRFFSAMA
ncbi:MAG TPA: very short patch repair endonuclease [Candidatus Binatia bacterium]|nr:very short patch repair endonuclease [Candidatus Binatia bacterium]